MQRQRNQVELTKHKHAMVKVVTQIKQSQNWDALAK